MVPSNLEVIQINLQHCKEATAILGHCLTMLHTVIALVQEPWIYLNQVRGLGFVKGNLFVDTTNPTPRACILVTKDVNATLLPEFTNRDLVAVEVKHQVGGVAQRVVFASVYLPFDSVTPPPSQEMEALVAYCEQHQLPIILGCDANAHNISWGSLDTNLRGQALMEYLVGTNLLIHFLAFHPSIR